MQPQISFFTLEDKVYPLREAVQLDLDEKKNHYGMYVLQNNDYNILGIGHTIEDAVKVAAGQLAMIYHIYTSLPERELSSEAIVFKNKLKNLIIN